MAFKMMENVGNFLAACESYGVNRLDLFQTADLYDGTNMVAVIDGIHALGRVAKKNKFNGPLPPGPAESAGNHREFSQEQLRAGEGIIGLQAGTGSAKGANQSGMNFGLGRQINQHQEKE
eukprot:CAMPEP_0170561916 /NCGR_PEP_ID=MMETSP0211-20121228/57814_1 /TAXON_ID=311385 /ORGANISM="Pseudokeronopsis sp., Strain OXSARD2" /LENGTH=119 /DNA_ID=CAMNT_0010878129 /DNA_START=29 /DNA_END=388 /DNA_ORIENTATION=-